MDYIGLLLMLSVVSWAATALYLPLTHTSLFAEQFPTDDKGRLRSTIINHFWLLSNTVTLIVVRDQLLTGEEANLATNCILFTFVFFTALVYGIMDLLILSNILEDWAS